MGVKNTSNKRTSYGVVSNNPEMPNQLSKTPKNFSKNNYYLKEIQDQVNAYWDKRPNHADVEQEITFGEEDYYTYEVVAQSVKNDSGSIISDDWRRFVFRDIHYDCPIGTKFRVAPGYDVNIDNKDKFIFLVVNKQNELTATNAVVVRRCNGTLGTTYLDNHGVLQYHYEPAVQLGITSTGLHYSEVANDPNSALTVIVQHNKYTKNYYINQRFVIGYDRTYKITNIDKFYSNDTYNPENVGLITLYMSICSIADEDDFATRIAYNEAQNINRVNEISADDYSIVVTTPNNDISSEIMPTVLISGDNIFEAQLYNGNNKIEHIINFGYEIEGLNEAEWSKYVETAILENNKFNVIKKRFCTRAIKLRFYINAEDSPVEKLIETTLTASLAGII